MLYEIHQERVWLAKTDADQEVASSETQVPIVALGKDLKAGSSYHVRASVPFELDGAASGYRFSMVFPSSFYALRIRIDDQQTPELVADSFLTGTLTSTGTTGGALAEAGVHFLTWEGIVSPTADGSLYLRYAQYVSDADAIRILSGAFLEITKLN